MLLQRLGIPLKVEQIKAQEEHPEIKRHFDRERGVAKPATRLIRLFLRSFNIATRRRAFSLVWWPLR